MYDSIKDWSMIRWFIGENAMYRLTFPKTEVRCREGVVLNDLL